MKLLAYTEQFKRAALLAAALLFSASHTAVGLVLILCALIVESLITRRIPWTHSPASTATFCFVAAFLLSGIASAYRVPAIGSAVLSGLTMYLAFGPLYGTLRQDPSFLRPFLWAWIVGGLFVAGWTILSHGLTNELYPTVPTGRTSLATTLLIAFALSLGAFLITRSSLRYLAGLACGLTAITLILTYSRGAWLGALVACGFLLTRTRRQLVGAALSLIILTLTFALLIANAEGFALRQRADTIFSLTANRQRVALAQSAIAIFRDHPLVGTGLNTFSLVHLSYPNPNYTDYEPRAFAHNIFLNMAAEGGLVGLGAFGAVVWVGLAAGWRWNRRSLTPDEKIISAAVFAAYIGLLVNQQFDGTIISVHIGAGFWFLIAIQTAFASMQPSALGKVEETLPAA